MTWIAAVLALLGLSAAVYPTTAAWFSALSQAQVVRDYSVSVEDSGPPPTAQLEAAHAYNAALAAGVRLEAGANVPTGVGESTDGTLDYDRMLVTGPSGVMARIRVPAVDIDLPIYHGTDDATLLQGAGHLEGSHLPVGGVDTHTVITAHRGLANAAMFTELDGVGVGDRFTIETLGEVLTYEVVETKVVEPDETDSLRAVAGEDLVTLVTCTPLGINSHRILVTGERVTPTPIADIESAGTVPEVPGFPWWSLWLGGGVVLAVAFVWRSGYTDARRRAPRIPDPRP